MPVERTGAGDPARTLALLWRREVAVPPRRGPRPRLSVDDVVGAAVALADAEGVGAVSMRRLADDLGVSTMSLYGYVPSKAELVDLMLDEVHGAMAPARWRPQAGWRTRARRVAEANAALYAAHPWAAHVSTARPALGPGSIGKYDHELGAFADCGLGDVAMDAALTFLLGFVRSDAVAREGAATAAQDTAWWAVAGPLLGRYAAPERFPLAARVGTAAGEAQGTAYDPDAAFAFGLERVLDGLAALVDAPSQPG